MHEPRPKPEPTEVFISYSHEDEKLLEQLTTVLSDLEREGVIKVWHGGMVDPGADWEKEIKARLKRAKVILLLVSPDFISSHYCYEVEAGETLKRHKTGKALVIPIILYPVPNWRRLPFGKFQALPKNARPLTDWPSTEEAFVNIAEGVRKAVQDFRARRVKARVIALIVVLSLLLSAPAFFIFVGRFFNRPRISGVDVGGPPSTLYSLTTPHAASTTPTPTAVKQSSSTDGLGLPATRATIRFTVIPPYDEKGDDTTPQEPIAGVALGVAPGNYRVVVYALTLNTWWVQPTSVESLTEIGEGGKWAAKTHRGTRYAALLVPADFTPPSRTTTLPSERQGALASAEVNGKRR